MLCYSNKDVMISIEDTVSSLRKRLNTVERDRLEAATKSNREVSWQGYRKMYVKTLEVKILNSFFILTSYKSWIA